MSISSPIWLEVWGERRDTVPAPPLPTRPLVLETRKDIGIGDTCENGSTVQPLITEATNVILRTIYKLEFS